MREAKGFALFIFQVKKEELREKEDEEGLFIFQRKYMHRNREEYGALTQAQKSRGEYGHINAVRLH